MKKVVGLFTYLTLLFCVGCQREVPQILDNQNDSLQILGFSPDSAKVGDLVLVKGRGFDTLAYGNVVSINNVQQQVVQASDTVLVIKIMAATTTGKIVVAAKSQQAISSSNLVIGSATQQQLMVLSFSPDSACIGDTITIKAKGFSAIASDNLVTINSTAAELISSKDSILIIKISPGTTTGKISVVSKGQSAISSNNLVIVSVSPWIQKADFPALWGDFTAVTGISAGGKGFFFKRELWEYQPLQNAWVKKADKPSDNGGAYSFAFSISNKIYIGYGGYPGLDSVKLWEYDIANNSWTKKRNLPIRPRLAPFAFSVNNIGYVGGGQISFSSDMHAHDFWKYDALNDTWSRLADFPGSWTIGISGLVIGNEPYVYDTGLGYPQAPTFASGEGRLWRYDISTNTWVERARNPGGDKAMSAAAFAIGNKGYVAVAVAKTPADPKNDFWMYDPGTNAWTKKTDVGGGLRWFGSGFAIGNKGYVGLGTGDTYAQKKKDFWEYTPE